MSLPWVFERLEAGSKPVLLLTWVALLVGAGVVLGVASTLIMLGFWPFYKLTAWLLG